MTLTATRSALVLIASAGLASAASAGMPEVMDIIPAGSLAGVVAPSLDSLDRATINLFTSVGMPILTTPSQMLAEAGFAQGIDADRPLAVAIVPGPMDEDEPPMVLFIPTSDQGALFGQFDHEDAGDGLTALSMDGETIFAKPIGGGYTIAGPMHDVIAAFEGAHGQMAAHEAMMGEHARQVAGHATVFSFLSMPALAPLLEDQWEDFREQMHEGLAEGMNSTPGLGNDVDPEQLATAADAMLDMLEAMIDDGMYGVAGLQVGSMGVGGQMALDFEPGSQTAAMFKTGGNAQESLAQLPDAPFIFASAYDLSNSAAQSFVSMGKELVALSGVGETGIPGLKGMLTGTEGGASAMYVTPGGLMAGVFSGMLNYTKVDDPAAYMKGFEQMSAAADGLMPMTFTRNADTLNGLPVHGWGMDIPMDPNNPMAMQMMQISQMLFGGPTIGGYFIEAPGGVYQTMGQDLGFAKAAVSHEGGSLAKNETLAQVREMLPEPAVMESYVNLGSIYNMLAPMAAMMGIQIQTPVPADLPPIGTAVATGDGGVSAGTFVPAPVLRAGMGVAMELQAMGLDGGGNDHQGNEDQDEAPY